ncbi:MAG: undecaprenyldiphospho-muramoylpentapeptide beta-N-acetylglucosaminyltransferase [Deltaproteobacteria bacterium]|nr:undecaprenyldiphospho-muramoylpentapeptide beta-N-acetylglucosaminyltransferase [Deltaproteobacteria bacterium]
MKILLACGGTGGHLFPGIALAEVFREKLKDVEIVFVGTPRGLEKEVLSKTDWRLQMIAVSSLADKKSFGKISAALQVLRSLGSCFKLLRQEKPDLVIGIGGYAAGPVVMMASLMGKKTISLEPNAVPGMTNRILKIFVNKMVTAYPGMEKYFGKKTLFLGVPIRKSILEDVAQSVPMLKKVVFAFGGSQGSKTINDAILGSLFYLQDMKDKIHFIHQVGKHANVETIEKAYRDSGISAEVYPFIERMGLCYGKADLVIARSGANTLAELISLKKPSLLVPYPFSAGHHQEANARSLEQEGGARVIPDAEMGGQHLAREIRRMITSPYLMEEMQENLSRLGGGQATTKIVEACLNGMGMNV